MEKEGTGKNKFNVTHAKNNYFKTFQQRFGLTSFELLFLHYYQQF
jgi:hypothetical protein